MGITRRKEAQAPASIDKSAYIGMEVEHSNDTAGVVNAANQKTLNIASTQIFMDKNIRDNGQIRSQAFKKMWTLLFYAQNTVYLQNYI